MSLMSEMPALICTALAVGMATFVLTTASMQHSAAWAAAARSSPVLAAPLSTTTAGSSTVSAHVRPHVPVASGEPPSVESVEATAQGQTSTSWALLATLAAIPVCVAGAIAALRGAKGSPETWDMVAATAEVDKPAAQMKIVDSVQAMLTPLGYYEAYELLVVVSPRLSEIEKEERLSSLEALFAQNKCKKVAKVDRGRRLLAYPIRGSIEASMVIYTFKGPRFMPKLINTWFIGPGLNSDGNVFRCFLTKQRRMKPVGAGSNGVLGEEEAAAWNV